ncbi:MAG: AI-2E family transporter, partial [Aggregatilineales bacterium]
PLLVAGRINLPPALVLLAQIVFGLLFGFLGLLLAVPLAAILMVIVQEVYIRDILGDKAVGLAEPASVPSIAPKAEGGSLDNSLITRDTA